MIFFRLPLTSKLIFQNLTDVLVFPYELYKDPSELKAAKSFPGIQEFASSVRGPQKIFLEELKAVAKEFSGLTALEGNQNRISYNFLKIYEIFHEKVFTGYLNP